MSIPVRAPVTINEGGGRRRGHELWAQNESVYRLQRVLASHPEAASPASQMMGKRFHNISLQDV